LLSDSGLQRCVADLDSHGWLPEFKGKGKSGANSTKSREMGFCGQAADVPG
jgi:hypothetical protein